MVEEKAISDIYSDICNLVENARSQVAWTVTGKAQDAVSLTVYKKIISAHHWTCSQIIIPKICYRIDFLLSEIPRPRGNILNLWSVCFRGCNDHGLKNTFLFGIFQDPDCDRILEFPQACQPVKHIEVEPKGMDFTT